MVPATADEARTRMSMHVGTMSIDGTPISQADMVRLAAEEKLHDEQQRRAARVIAAASLDVDDCRMLLSALGLGSDTVRAARTGAPAKRPRKRRAA
jgi:hypothetical protein